MGTSRSGAELARKLQALGTATERRAAATVAEGALAAKTIMLQSAASRGLTPSSRIAGRRWNVRFDVKGKEKPTALVRYTGPFHLFDNPTDPHIITAKRLGRRTSRRSRQSRATSGGAGAFGGFGDRGGAKALHFGGSFFAYVHHPGTPGARSFPVAKAAARERVPRVMAARQRATWERVLG